MIKFYCEKCGKELNEKTNWDYIKDLTLEQISYILICSDCANKEVELIKQKGEDSWDWIRNWMKNLEETSNDKILL